MTAFWNNLQWPRVAERFAFITVVVNVCNYACEYCITNIKGWECYCVKIVLIGIVVLYTYIMSNTGLKVMYEVTKYIRRPTT